MNNKITVRTCKPRNPLVVPSQRRLAGRHALRRAPNRQQAAMALRRELDPMTHSP